jgi:hypothetical protein
VHDTNDTKADFGSSLTYQFLNPSPKNPFYPYLLGRCICTDKNDLISAIMCMAFKFCTHTYMRMHACTHTHICMLCVYILHIHGHNLFSYIGTNMILNVEGTTAA